MGSSCRPAAFSLRYACALRPRCKAARRWVIPKQVLHMSSLNPPDPTAGHGGTLRQITLFKSREGGYHTYRIPGLVVSADRTVLAFCEARKNSSADYGQIDILLRRSLDGGETWAEPSVLVDGKSQTANNATMIADPDSPEIHFVYCIAYRRAFYTRSRDAGATFDPPVEITHVFEEYRKEYNWLLLATGPGHGIRLRGGRLIVPVWFSTHEEQKPTMASVIYSDDNGRRWHRGPIVVRDDDGQNIANPMEPVVIELSDGGVMLNVRNASPAKRRAVSVSADGVNGWSPLRFDPQLHDPFCMSSVCRLAMTPRDTHNAMLYAGPDDLSHSDQPGTANVGGCDRKRVTVRLSYDEGQTWLHARVLEPDWSGYSDLAVGADKVIYCLYESGCVGDWMWDIESLRLAMFDEKWLTR